MCCSWFGVVGGVCLLSLVMLLFVCSLFVGCCCSLFVDGCAWLLLFVRCLSCVFLLLFVVCVLWFMFVVDVCGLAFLVLVFVG